MDFSFSDKLSTLPSISQRSAMLLKRVVTYRPYTIIDKSSKRNNRVENAGKGSTFIFSRTSARTKITTFSLMRDQEISVHDLPKYYRVLVDGVEYTKFGPSSVLMSHGLTKKWTDEKGRRHRIGGPAIINMDVDGRQELRKEFWVNGVQHNDNGPAVVDIGSNYEKLRGRFSSSTEETPENALAAFKTHMVNGKIARKDPHRPLSVSVRDGSVRFDFGAKHEFLSVYFNVVPNDRDVNDREEHELPSLRLVDVERMIAEFDSVDEEGNDLSDQYVLDIILNH